MTVVAHKESGSCIAMPNNKGLTCMSYEDTLREMEAYLDGKLEKPQSPEDVYADITEPMSSNAVRLPDSEDPDATENSSSFGDTFSRSENVSGTSDVEVESEFRVDSGWASMLDGNNGIFPVRKKKLTDHWKSFIRPLMWRCKWTELRIKELESQALIYSHELEANDQTKMLELHQYTSDFCSKTFPYFNHPIKRKPMNRRKRKVVENVTDVSSYMSHHNLFSYLENKKSNPDGTSTADDVGDQDLHTKNEEFSMDDDWLKDGDDSLEQILQQIETVQSQVHRIRNHLDMLMFKHDVKFSSSEDLSLLAPYDAQTSAAQSPAFSAGNGDTISMMGPIYYDSSQHLPDFEFGDLVLPESMVSGDGEGNQIPDIIESTVGLLCAAEVTIHQSQIVESGENILDDAEVLNRVVQDELVSSGVIDQSIDASDELENKISSLPGTTDPVTEDALAHKKSTLNSCLTSDIQIPKNKRKRGDRKAGPGAWNLKSSGDPDSI